MISCHLWACCSGEDASYTGLMRVEFQIFKIVYITPNPFDVTFTQEMVEKKPFLMTTTFSDQTASLKCMDQEEAEERSLLTF